MINDYQKDLLIFVQDARSGIETSEGASEYWAFYIIALRSSERVDVIKLTLLIDGEASLSWYTVSLCAQRINFSELKVLPLVAWHEDSQISSNKISAKIVASNEEGNVV